MLGVLDNMGVEVQDREQGRSERERRSKRDRGRRQNKETTNAQTRGDMWMSALLWRHVVRHLKPCRCKDEMCAIVRENTRCEGFLFTVTPLFSERNRGNTAGWVSRNCVCEHGSRRTRRSSSEQADSRRVARPGSGQTLRDQQLHETRRCSCWHTVRCASHSTHANDMGDHTDTRFKSESQSLFGRLGILRSAVGSKTHCITNGVTTWSTTPLDCGRITGHGSVQSRRKFGPRTPLRTHVHDSFCVAGWSDASWFCRREGSSQGGHLVGITNTPVLQQTACEVSLISWHSGKLARVARKLECSGAASSSRCRKRTHIYSSVTEVQHHWRSGRTLRPRCPQHWLLTPEEYSMRSCGANHRAYGQTIRSWSIRTEEVLDHTVWVTMDTLWAAQVADCMTTRHVRTYWARWTTMAYARLFLTHVCLWWLLSLQFSRVCTVIESRGTCQELSCSTVRITADLVTTCSLTGNIATKSWSMSDEWLTDGWPKCIPCLSASYHIDVREVVLSWWRTLELKESPSYTWWIADSPLFLDARSARTCNIRCQYSNMINILCTAFWVPSRVIHIIRCSQHPESFVLTLDWKD